MASSATAPSRRYAAQQPPQDIRAGVIAMGMRWCVPGGHWYHESAEAQHGGFRCKARRPTRQGTPFAGANRHITDRGE